ncbi:MAG: carboxypeptidase-like regulatory domain-containing protein [Nocardioidaceae bacterium]|nr:carboxypeptidase-like regulatory domain-containing protein [Nocardioidaceae bacterium]MCL2613931.1 carboxypeptidase-like regulatory domain-containing protein [Nocardioidaceae bacterium]
MTTRRLRLPARAAVVLLALVLAAVLGPSAEAVGDAGEATMSGTISLPGGAAYPGGASLVVYRLEGATWTQTSDEESIVDDDGTWTATVGLQTSSQTFRVELAATGGYDAQFYSTSPPAWDLVSATDIPLAVGGSAQHIDFTLATNSGYGSIGGTVTGTGGAPVGTLVKLYQDGSSATDITALSDSLTGAWSARVPAGTYRVSFSEYDGDGWATAWYGGTDLASATPVTVTGNGSVGGIGALLTPDPGSATIGGTVTGPDGSPLVGVDVRLYDQADTDTWAVLTAPDGTWSASVTGGASYKLGFSTDTGDAYAAQYYPAKPTLAAGQVITPAAGSDVTKYDARLAYALADTSAPTVGGPPVMGRTLTASPGVWTSSGVRFGYQWRADGAPIAHATARALVLTRSLVGERITVCVNARKDGYAPVSAVSGRTAGVRAPATVSLHAWRAAGGRTVIGVRVSAAVAVGGLVRLRDGSRALGTVRLVRGYARRTVRLSLGPHVLRASYLGSPMLVTAAGRAPYDAR